MRLLLIDGDDLVWRVAVTAPSAAAIDVELSRRIQATARALRGDRLVFALSDASNWRKALWSGYKVHRAKRMRPPLLSACRAALEAQWETRSAPGLEADDVLGLAATDPAFLDPSGPGSVGYDREPETIACLRRERASAGAVEPVIVSRDKDLLTVPGLHGAGSGALIRVSSQEAETAHLALALAGDPVDGFKGCPGVGPKRARRILASASPEPAAQWRAVEQAYQAAGLGEKEALLQARLARVLRRGEIDAAGRPILWRPE